MRTGVMGLAVLVLIGGVFADAFGQGFMGSKKLLIPELTEAPTVDGTGSDAAWAGGFSVNMTDQYNDVSVRVTPSQADHFGTMTAGWHGSSIFLRFEITDDSLDYTAMTGLGSSYNADGIEILLDLNNLQIPYPVSGVNQATQFADAAGPCQIRAMAFDVAAGNQYNIIFFNDQSGVQLSSTAVPSSTALMTYAHSAFANGFTAEFELKISAAALALAGAATLDEIDSFGFLVNYNDSDALGAPAPPNGGTAGVGHRDAQILWWGGPSNEPTDGVVTYNDGQVGTFYNTSSGLFSEAGFVGPGEGNLVDTGWTPPTFIDLVDFPALTALLEGMAAAEQPLLGFPVVIPESVTAYWMVYAMLNPLMPHSAETMAAFANNGQVLMDAGMNAASLSNIGVPLLITAGEPFTAYLVNHLQTHGLPGISLEDFVTVPYFVDAGDYDGDLTTNADSYTPGNPMGFLDSQFPELPAAGMVVLLITAAVLGAGGALAARKKD